MGSGRGPDASDGDRRKVAVRPEQIEFTVGGAARLPTNGEELNVF